MKRSRGNQRNGTAAVTTARAIKKRARGAAAAKVAADEPSGEAKKGVIVAAYDHETVAELEEEEVWGSLWSGVVDEDMSWATCCWCPFWEMEDAYDALYGDVMWDFDIWDLKSSTTTEDVRKP